MSALPRSIGKYQVTEELGRGAMGVVYKGFDPHIDRTVAIKTIHAELLGDAGMREAMVARFRNEAQAVGRIVHPGVVAIHDFGEDAGTAYIAMEYVAGRNLEQVLAATPLLPLPRVLRLMDELLSALASAHRHGVWHRDIKAANLLLGPGGQVKLTDFGIARIGAGGLTQVASRIGTPGSMAPEQYIAGDAVDHRVDVFACGVLLYRLLAGRAAFRGHAEAVMFQVLHEDPPAPGALGGRPPGYDALVARAMARAPERRFAGVAEMRQALLEITTAGSGSSGGGDATLVVGSGALAPQGWNAELLGRMERALARHAGPMARVLVREAARDCATPAALVRMLAPHVADEARRAEFVAQALGTVAPGSEAGAPGEAAEPLTDAFREAVEHALTLRIGPVAGVLVRRAADAGGGDRGRFVARLAGSVSAAERAGLLRVVAGLVGSG